jgi:hypothetical protein
MLHPAEFATNSTCNTLNNAKIQVLKDLFAYGRSRWQFKTFTDAAAAITSPPVLTNTPSAVPTISPTAAPTAQPTLRPTVVPTAQPTVVPTIAPTIQPTVVPTVKPTVQPTVVPTVVPSVVPTDKPTVEVCAESTVQPTSKPTRGKRTELVSKKQKEPTEDISSPLFIGLVSVGAMFTILGALFLHRSRHANVTVINDDDDDTEEKEPLSPSVSSALSGMRLSESIGGGQEKSVLADNNI